MKSFFGGSKECELLTFTLWIDRNISMGYWKRKSYNKSFDLQHIFSLILWRYVVFFNDIITKQYHKILKKYADEDGKNTFTKKYMDRSSYINKNCS